MPPQMPPHSPQWPQPQQAPESFDFANAVPAYGIPPQAFRNQSPPQAPAPPAPQAFDAYTQGVQNAYGGYAGTGGSSGTSDALMSRLKGAGVLLIGLALLGFNAFLIFTQDYFYPKTLIIAFPVCWGGFFMMLAGKPVKPGTHTQPGWWLVGMFAGCFFALVAGIVAAVMITE
jgi:hypothetical protein